MTLEDITKETRVGYVAIDIMDQILKQYIESHTIDHKYTGVLHYLNVAKQYSDYLNDNPELEYD